MRLANVMSGKGTEGQGVVKRGTTPYVSPVTQSFRYSPLLRDAPDVRSGKERDARGTRMKDKNSLNPHHYSRSPYAHSPPTITVAPFAHTVWLEGEWNEREMEM